MNLLESITQSIQVNSYLSNDDQWVFEEPVTQFNPQVVQAKSSTSNNSNSINQSKSNTDSMDSSSNKDQDHPLQQLVKKRSAEAPQEKTLKDLKLNIPAPRSGSLDTPEIYEAKDLDEFNHQLYKHPWYTRQQPAEDHHLNLIIGQGPIQPKLMIVCFQPYPEDIQIKQPLAGAAGELLRNMLKAIGYEKNLSYITYLDHSVNPKRRMPREVKMLSDHLKHEIKLVQPQAILLMGPELSEILLHESELKNLIQKESELYGVPTFATYPLHYMIHDPGWKKPAWHTLQFLKAQLDER